MRDNNIFIFISIYDQIKVEVDPVTLIMKLMSSSTQQIWITIRQRINHSELASMRINFVLLVRQEEKILAMGRSHTCLCSQTQQILLASDHLVVWLSEFLHENHSISKLDRINCVAKTMKQSKELNLNRMKIF